MKGREFDIDSFKIGERGAKRIKSLYLSIVDDIIKILRSGNALNLKDKKFAFKNYPAIDKKIEKLLKEFIDNQIIEINRTTSEAWELATIKNDNIIKDLSKKFKIDKGSDIFKDLNNRNLEALEVFQKRKINGVPTSNRVWRNTKRFKKELELALDIGLTGGTPASEISKKIKSFLRNPDTLYRRVRNKDGELIPSRAMKVFHPGQGVYRSSYKNAMRLVRTEVNMAYRESDHVRIKDTPYVLGIQINLSNNPNHCKTCETLAGRYPKSFAFLGWHPQCRCYVTTILPDDDDFFNSLNGGGYSRKGEVKSTPKNYNSFLKDNKDKKSLIGWISPKK